MPLPWQIQFQLSIINLLSDSFTPYLNSHLFSSITHLDSEQKARVCYTCQQTLLRSMDSKPFLGGWSEHSHHGTAPTSLLAIPILDGQASMEKIQLARKIPLFSKTPKIGGLISPVFQVRKLGQGEETCLRPSDRKHLLKVLLNSLQSVAVGLTRISSGQKC